MAHRSEVNLGRDAYEGYVECVVSQGEPQPPSWDELTEGQRQAWDEAALSVVGSVVMHSLGLG